MDKITYQIYYYDNQLKKIKNNKFKIEGYYYNLEESLREFTRASACFHTHQLILCEINKYSSKILAISNNGKVINISN